MILRLCPPLGSPSEPYSRDTDARNCASASSGTLSAVPQWTQIQMLIRLRLGPEHSIAASRQIGHTGRMSAGAGSGGVLLNGVVASDTSEPGE